MPRFPSKEEVEQRRLSNFAEIFSGAIKIQPDNSSEPQNLKKCRDDFFAHITSICPELKSVENEIIDLCDFYIRAYRSKAPRVAYAEFKKNLNGSGSKPGLIGTINNFIEDYNQHIQELYTASGSDLASIHHGDSFLPRVKSYTDISSQFLHLKNALDGYPSPHEPTMDDCISHLMVKNNRLKLLAKHFDQKGRTPDTPFQDFIFYLADIFEDCDIKLYPGTQRRKERSMFTNIIRFLFNKMPNDVHHLKSDTPNEKKDTFTKFIRATLKSKNNGKTQFKLSRLQFSQFDIVLHKLSKGIEAINNKKDPSPFKLTPLETKFLKRHINLFPKEFHQSINSVGK